MNARLVREIKVEARHAKSADEGESAGAAMRKGFTQLDTRALDYLEELSWSPDVAFLVQRVANSILAGGAVVTRTGHGAESVDPVENHTWTQAIRQIVHTLLVAGVAAVTLVPGPSGRLRLSPIPLSEVHLYFRNNPDGVREWRVFARERVDGRVTHDESAWRGNDTYAHSAPADAFGSVFGNGVIAGERGNLRRRDRLARLRGATVADTVMGAHEPLGGREPDPALPMRYAHVVTWTPPSAAGVPRSPMASAAEVIEWMHDLTHSQVANTRLHAQPPLVVQQPPTEVTTDEARTMRVPNAADARATAVLGASLGADREQALAMAALMNAERRAGGRLYRDAAWRMSGAAQVQIEGPPAAGRAAAVRLQPGEQVGNYHVRTGLDAVQLLAHLREKLATLFGVNPSLIGSAGTPSRLNSGVNTAALQASQDAQRAMRQVLQQMCSQMASVIYRTDVLAAAVEMVTDGRLLDASSPTVNHLKRVTGGAPHVVIQQIADVNMALTAYQMGLLKKGTIQDIMAGVSGIPRDRYQDTPKMPEPPPPPPPPPPKPAGVELGVGVSNTSSRGN